MNISPYVASSHVMVFILSFLINHVLHGVFLCCASVIPLRGDQTFISVYLTRTYVKEQMINTTVCKVEAERTVCFLNAENTFVFTWKLLFPFYIVRALRTEL